MTKKKAKRPTIEELEALLTKEEQSFETLPNGELRAIKRGPVKGRPPTVKPLTMRENLGGEYAVG